ncbi:MAG: hypothetical protein FIA92_06695 [Chloroflexi bacterium]|nr:hypothetical protein [Chloroflexota bacterium]
MRRLFPALVVLAIDEAMVEQAVLKASRIGVLATVPSGLEQQSRLLHRAARNIAKRVQVIPSVHPDAFSALQKGDVVTHDRILLAALDDLATRVELIVLAQASMSHLVSKIPSRLGVPVLASPPLAAMRMRKELDGREGA